MIEGINVVSTIIDNDKFRVHKNCKRMIEEFATYSWDVKAQQRGEDKPVKAQDDVMDALRYVCIEIQKHFIKTK